MTVLVVARKGKIFVEKNFETITEAYKYYVKHYATFGEWFYYFKTAHALLNHVDNEEIMKCLFKHCFYNACITITNEEVERDEGF